MMIGNRPQFEAQLKLNRPYVWVALERPWDRHYDMGWNNFELAFIWPTRKPDAAEMMTANHYRGFIWRFAFWFPITRA